MTDRNLQAGRMVGGWMDWRPVDLGWLTDGGSIMGNVGRWWGIMIRSSGEAEKYDDDDDDDDGNRNCNDDMFYDWSCFWSIIMTFVQLVNYYRFGYKFSLLFKIFEWWMPKNWCWKQQAWRKLRNKIWRSLYNLYIYQPDYLLRRSGVLDFNIISFLYYQCPP